MGAGQLNKRVTIQEPAEGSADAYNMPAITWPDVAVVWAEITPVVGLESVRGMVLQAETTHLVRIRYRAGVTHEMRFEWGNRHLYIWTPPLNVKERNKELLMQCKEEV